ncbi:uncharacterized protein LOC114711803 [Neltuma alba]|uniref:uncharacterized protein LOC114711803 n=1 Tax=Neltuma alba TaxID=207710 RepID=UPI0010A557DF|nr:uncharacterized protein LOC114711803 [Prosopis alba]
MMKTFGCACFPCLRPYNNHKFQFHFEKCVYLGPSGSHKGYKCLSPSGKVYISRHVILNESDFPIFASVDQIPVNIPASCSLDGIGILTHRAQESIPIVSSLPSQTTSPTHMFPRPPPQPLVSFSSPTSSSSTSSLPDFSPVSFPPTQPSTNHHPMVTGSKQEYNALVRNKTWMLVPPTSNQHVVGNKWVFKRKYRSDRTLDKLKARLVRRAIFKNLQAPCAWYDRLRITLLSWRFQNCRTDSSLFVYRDASQVVILLIYVVIFLLLEGAPYPTLVVLGRTLALNDSAPFHNPQLYRSIVGGLQYHVNTQLDICFSVSKLSQFLSAPTKLHWQAIKRLLRYLKGTLTSGYFVFFRDSFVSWSSKKQPVVSCSSAESENRGLANTTAKIMWIQSLLQELQIPRTSPPIIWCDSISATVIASNPISQRDPHFRLLVMAFSSSSVLACTSAPSLPTVTISSPTV